MKFKKREKILFSLVIGIVLAFFIRKAVFSGFFTRLKNVSGQIKLEEEKLKRGLIIQKEKDKVLKDYEEYSPYLNMETEDREILAKFLKEIEKISQASGVSLVNLNPDSQPGFTTEFKRFKAEVRLDANMEQLLNFLNKIQTSNLLIKVDKLSLAPKDEQSGILKVEVNISIIAPLN